MNTDRVKQFIKDLEEAKSIRADFVCMELWQSGETKSDLKNFHACGNEACAAGFLALTQSFKDAGGVCCPGGAPEFQLADGSFRSGEFAFAEYFEISDSLGSAICADYCEDDGESLDSVYEVMGGRPWQHWDAEDLIILMHAMLDGQLVGTERYLPTEHDHES